VFSLLNSHVPAHGSREILIIMGSLTTTDPGNIHDTISQLVQDNIRASVIALAAEVQVLKFLSTQTKGACACKPQTTSLMDLAEGYDAKD